jgi:flagellar biosynthesis GTPase FlhF
MIKHVAAIIVGAGVTGIILWKTPIVELLWGFLMFFAIPVALLASLGVITNSTAQLFMAGPAQLRDKVEAEINKLREAKEAPAAATPASTESKPAPKRETAKEKAEREKAEAEAAAKAKAKEERRLKKSLRVLQAHLAALEAAEKAEPETKTEEKPTRRRRAPAAPTT